MPGKREQRAPSLFLCALILLGVGVLVLTVNSITGSAGEVAIRHSGDAPTPWVCTAAPTPVVTDTPSPEPAPSPTPAPSPDAASAAPEASHWVLNTRSMRFHLPDCSSVPTIKETNREEFTGTRDALLEMGYTPCGSCKP